MVTYKERQKKKHDFVLMEGNNVIASFGNLRKLCNYINDESFPSYWTLVRKKEKDYPLKYGDYSIFKVKHY